MGDYWVQRNNRKQAITSGLGWVGRGESCWNWADTLHRLSSKGFVIILVSVCMYVCTYLTRTLIYLKL